MKARLLLSSFVFALTLSAPQTYAEPDQASAPLLAQKATKKKTKKKKPAPSETDNFGPADVEAIADSDQGVGIHREQEGVDTPYSAEINGSTELSFLSHKVKDGDTTSGLSLNVEGYWLFILGKIAIGPDIAVSYDKSTQMQTTEVSNTQGQVTGTQTDEIDVSSMTYIAGPLVKINFGRIDHDLLVFFAYGGLGYLASSTTSDGKSTGSSTGYNLKAGGGINLFVDSNVSFVPRAEFLLRSETEKGQNGADDVETTSSGLRLLLGIGVFI